MYAYVQQSEWNLRLSAPQILRVRDAISMRMYTIGLDSQILRLSESQIVRSSQALDLSQKHSDSQTLRLLVSQNLRFPDSQIFKFSDSQNP